MRNFVPNWISIFGRYLLNHWRLQKATVIKEEFEKHSPSDPLINHPLFLMQSLQWRALRSSTSFVASVYINLHYFNTCKPIKTQNKRFLILGAGVGFSLWLLQASTWLDFSPRLSARIRSFTQPSSSTALSDVTSHEVEDIFSQAGTFIQFSLSKLRMESRNNKRLREITELVSCGGRFTGQPSDLTCCT